jgi:release factor glutamine methyltransferase
MRETLLPSLESRSIELLNSLIQDKKRGVPLAHISKRTMFLDLEYITGPEALIPRVETELLGRGVINKLRELAKERGRLKVIDICTGSGNLALSYAHYIPEADIFCADISHSAISLAKENGHNLGLSKRVNFFEGDLFTPFNNDSFIGKCDLISCNPPYISTSKMTKLHNEIINFEPNLAFNGGIFGISFLSRIIKKGPIFLKPDSWLCFEVGLDQGPSLVKILSNDNRFAEIQQISNKEGFVRAILVKTGTV